MTPENDILAGGLVPTPSAGPANDPVARTHRIAQRLRIAPEVADDWLKVTSGIESGNRQFTDTGDVLTGPPTRLGSNWRARGMGQVMPDEPGGMVRTIKGRRYNLADPDENIEASLLLFSAGGADPVGRRLEYFGGERARKRYERTGQIPPGGDRYTSFQKYVTQTMGPPQRQQQQQPDILAGGLVPSPETQATPVSPAVAELEAVARQARGTEPTRPAGPQTPASSTTAPRETAPQGRPLTVYDAAWHFGMTPDQAQKLTRRQARVLNAAVLEDDRKRGEGQQITAPSLEYQNQMRARAGLAPLQFNMPLERTMQFGTITLKLPESPRAVSPYYQPERGRLPEALRVPPISTRTNFRLEPTAEESAEARARQQLRQRMENDPKTFTSEEYLNHLRFSRAQDSPRMRQDFLDHKLRQQMALKGGGNLWGGGSATNILVGEDVERARQQRVAQMGWPEYLAQAPKSVALGVTDTAATFLKSIAVLNQKMDQWTFGAYKKDTKDLPAYRLGEAIQRETRNLPGFLKSNPDLEQEFLVGQSPQTIGQVFTFMFGGWVSKAPKVATVILGSGLTAGDAYDEVRANGGSDADAVNAALVAGGLLGPTELFGLKGAMKAVTNPTMKATWRAALKQAWREGRRDIVENVLQEMGQEWAQGEITGKRRTQEEIFAAGVQGVVGGGPTIPITAIANRPRKEARELQSTPDVTAKPDEAPIALPEEGRPIVPEPPSAIAAQMDALTSHRGNRFAVLVPKGQSAPTKIPKGYMTTRTSEGVVIHPKELQSDDVRELVDKGDTWRLLGHANPEGPDATRIVVARSGIEAQGGVVPGSELMSSYVIPGQEQNAIDEMRAQFAPYQPTFEVGGVETAAKVVSERSGELIDTQGTQRPESDAAISESVVDSTAAKVMAPGVELRGGLTAESPAVVTGEANRSSLEGGLTSPVTEVSRPSGDVGRPSVQRGPTTSTENIRHESESIPRAGQTNERFANLSNAQIEAYIENTRRQAERQIKKLSQRPPKGTPASERQARPRRLDRLRGRMHQRVTEAQLELDQRRAGRGDIPSFETWVETQAGGEAGGIRADSLTESERADYQRQYDERFYPTPHHSNFQNRRRRGPRKGQFAPGKAEAPPATQEARATGAQPEAAPLEQAEGQLFATEPAVPETPTAQPVAATRGSQEQAARDLEAERTKLTQEATNTLSRPQYSVKGEPVSVESVLQRQVDRANDLRLEILRRVENTDERQALEEQYPPFTLESARASTNAQPAAAPVETQSAEAPRQPKRGGTGRPKLNPSVDSLETAIRALGGIKDDSSGELKTLRESGRAGTVTAEGRSAEDMAMALAELGYGRDVWWSGSLRQGDATFTGVNANDFIAAATEDASGSRKHYSNAVEMDVSAEEEKYWRSRMEPKEQEQWDASQKFLRSRKAQRLLGEIADGKSTRKKLRELRELGKRYGLEEDVVNEHVRLAQRATTQPTAKGNRPIPDTAREATGTEGRPLTGEYVDEEGTLRSEAGEPLFSKGRRRRRVKLADLFHERGLDEVGGVYVKPRQGQALERELFDPEAIKRRLGLPDTHTVEVEPGEPLREPKEGGMLRNLDSLLDHVFNRTAPQVGEDRTDMTVTIRIKGADGKRDLTAEDRLVQELSPRYEEPPVDLGDVETKRPEKTSDAEQYAREQAGYREITEALERETQKAERETGEGDDIQDLGDIPEAARAPEGWSNADAKAREVPQFTVQENRITLENQEASELLTKAYEQMGLAEPSDRGLGGVFEQHAERLARQLDKMEDEGASDFAQAVRAAGKTGEGKVLMAFGERSMTHERFHESSAAANRYLQDRHADFAAFESDPTFQLIRTALTVDMNYPDKMPTLVEEAAAYIASGDYQRLGISRRQAITFLQKWFESFIAHNGEVSVERFQEMAEDGQAALQRAVETRKRAASKGADESVSGVQEGREKGATEGRAPPAEFTIGGPLENLGGMEMRFDDGTVVQVIASPDDPSIGFITGIEGRDIGAKADTITTALGRAGFSTVDYRPDNEDGRAAARKRLFESIQRRITERSDEPLFSRRPKDVDEKLRALAKSRGQTLREAPPPKPTTAPPGTVREFPPPKPRPATARESQTKERSFPKTAEAAGFRGGNDRDYTELTNAASIEQAEREIMRAGAARAAADLLATEEPSAVDVAKGILLMQRFERQREVGRAVQVAGHLARKLTEAGQRVQAASIVSRLSPQGVLLHASRIAKDKPLTEETAATLVEQSKVLTAAEELVARIQNERPDIFGPDGEILPRPVAAAPAGARRSRGRRTVRATVGTLHDRLALLEQEARARMEARKNQGGTVLSAGGLGSTKIAADLGDLVIIGAAKLARKGITRAVWIAEMMTEAPKLSRRDMGRLYKESYERFERERKQFRRESRERGAARHAAATGEPAPVTPRDYDRIIADRLDAQTAARKARADLAKSFQDLQAGRTIRTLRQMRDVWNLSRALITSLDLSAAGRQGKMGLVTHPKAWLRGVGRQFKALSTKQYDRMVSEMQLDADYKYARRFKLHLTTLAGTEEVFQSEFAGKVPWVKHSQQAYDTMLDTLRFGWFKATLQKYRTAGINLDDLDLKEQFIRDTSLINAFTGRGGGKTMERVGPTLSMFYFSPRFWASRLKVLSLPLDPRMYGLGANSYSRQARVDAWKTLFGFYGLVATQIGLAKLLGAAISFDPEDEDFIFNPDSPDFLKARFGNTHIDFSAGLQTHLRVAARLAKSFYMREFQKGKPRRSPTDILAQYSRSKEQPNVALLHDLFFSTKKDTEHGRVGTDFAGQPVFLLGEPGKGGVKRLQSSALAQRILPIVLQDALDAYTQGIGWRQAVPGIVMSVVGEGVNTYAPGYSERRDKFPMAAEMERLQITINPPQRIKPGKYEKFKAETDSEYEARRKVEAEAIKQQLKLLEGMTFFKRLPDRDKEAEIRATIKAARDSVRWQQPAVQRKEQAAATP